MSSIRTAELAPLAMSILGMDSPTVPTPAEQRDAVAAASLPPSPNPQHTRSSAFQPLSPNSQQTRASADRRTSHYNSFQTRCSPSNDSPPSYATSARLARFPIAERDLNNGNEILPKYTANVLKEGPMYMRIEKISPFQYLPKQQWRSVYVILRGTQMSIYKAKTSTFGSDTVTGPGKPIRKYTLQHAEVGLATDVNDHVLVPVSRLASLIPAVARRKAFSKDQDLFRADKQHSLRLRVETDQFLLADCSEEIIFEWTSAFCSSIDISSPIDERSLPRQCTVPRRRRQRRPEQVNNLEDRQLIEEQERILREMYPTLARSIGENATTTNPNNDNTSRNNDNGDESLNRIDTNTNVSNDQQDAEDVDISVMAEDLSLEATITRPHTSRQTTATTMNSSMSSSQPSSPSSFDANGKWAPVHPQSASQQLRYTRRCMPVLLFASPRCSSIVMCHGRRLRINHRMDMLEEWELEPPTYDAHDFSSLSATADRRSSLVRRMTVTSNQDTSSIERTGSDLDIQVVRSNEGEGLGLGLGLDLGLGSMLEKTQTSSSIPAKVDLAPVFTAGRTPLFQRQSKIDEHSPVEQNFAALTGF